MRNRKQAVATPTPNPSPQGGGESARDSRQGGSALTPEEEDIKQKGLVLILKELHDKLDALVFEETAAVMRVLASATAPLSIADVVKSFAQGKSIEKRVELTICALTRLGHLTSTDGAKTFALRRVA